MSHQFHNLGLCPQRLYFPNHRQSHTYIGGYDRACGTCLTSCPISWHPTANTSGFFDVESNRARVLRSLLFCSVSFIALSRQKSSLLCGGVQLKCPLSNSDEYSSNVLISAGPWAREIREFVETGLEFLLEKGEVFGNFLVSPFSWGEGFGELEEFGDYHWGEILVRGVLDEIL